MKRPVFTGAAVAIITPMNTDGSVNYDELGRIIDDQIAHSTDAIVICGTTGESPTLTDEEHTECIRYTVKKTAGRVPVIAGTGSNDTKYAIWLSQQAEADGADALLLVTPYYNKTSQAGLLAHYTAIADAVHIPCILYNVPSRTGCNLTPATLAELAKHPNINAVKEASGNISHVAEIAAACGDSLNIYSGDDAAILARTDLLDQCAAHTAIDALNDNIRHVLLFLSCKSRAKAKSRPAAWQWVGCEIISAGRTPAWQSPAAPALRRRAQRAADGSRRHSSQGGSWPT